MEPIDVYPDKFKGEYIKYATESTRYEYIYMHGRLEKMSGYDCCNMDYCPVSKGVYPAFVHFPHTAPIGCVLFFKPSDRPGQRGLIVDPSDEVGMEEARTWYNRS